MCADHGDLKVKVPVIKRPKDLIPLFVILVVGHRQSNLSAALFIAESL
jgi:hypothetical protein